MKSEADILTSIVPCCEQMVMPCANERIGEEKSPRGDKVRHQNGFPHSLARLGLDKILVTNVQTVVVYITTSWQTSHTTLPSSAVSRDLASVSIRNLLLIDLKVGQVDIV